MNFPGKSIDELVREELDEEENGKENGEDEEQSENGDQENGDSDANDDIEEASMNNKGNSFNEIFQNHSQTK